MVSVPPGDPPYGSEPGGHDGAPFPPVVPLDTPSRDPHDEAGLPIPSLAVMAPDEERHATNPGPFFYDTGQIAHSMSPHSTPAMQDDLASHQDVDPTQYRDTPQQTLRPTSSFFFGTPLSDSPSSLPTDSVDPDWALSIMTACDQWVIGQGHTLRLLWHAVLAGGHVLIQGPSGTGKSMVCHTLLTLLGLPSHHLPLTADLSPKDLIGSVAYNPTQHTWDPIVGPLFTHAVLVDDINRAPGTVQSALLTAMSDRTLVIGPHTIPLPHPFVVLGTQTPDQDGTYPLCQSLMDRWMISLPMGYPSMDAEQQLVTQWFNPTSPPVPIATPDHLALAQSSVAKVYIDDRLIQSIIQLVTATRRPDTLRLSHLAPLIEQGASIRASHALVAMAKATAWCDHRTYVIPDDIKAVVKPVLRHRVTLRYDAHAQAITPDLFIDQLMAGLPIL